MELREIERNRTRSSRQEPQARVRRLGQRPSPPTGYVSMHRYRSSDHLHSRDSHSRTAPRPEPPYSMPRSKPDSTPIPDRRNAARARFRSCLGPTRRSPPLPRWERARGRPALRRWTLGEARPEGARIQPAAHTPSASRQSPGAARSRASDRVTKPARAPRRADATRGSRALQRARLLRGNTETADQPAGVASAPCKRPGSNRLSSGWPSAMPISSATLAIHSRG